MASTTVTAKTVLVADDTAFVRDRFRAALENAGHKAVVVKSAAELLARIKADLTSIDLVVLDLRLPYAPGVDLVRSIRKLDNGRLPLLIFSGTIANADEVRALASLGVAGYLNEYSAGQHILPALAPHLFPDNFNRRALGCDPRDPGPVSIRQHHCRRADAESGSRRSRDPHDEPARCRLEDLRAVQNARHEA
jgi:CheY-like chemotaxis protein